MIFKYIYIFLFINNEDHEEETFTGKEKVTLVVAL